jgi:hypothetical protein
MIKPFYGLIKYDENKVKNEERLLVNENLDSYWMCLNGLEQKRWFTKELHLRKELNLKTMSD